MLLFQYFFKNNILLNFFNQIIFLLIIWIIFKLINLTELLQINPHTIYFFIKKILTIFSFILKQMMEPEQN